MTIREFKKKHQASSTLYYELKKEIEEETGLNLKNTPYQLLPRTASIIYDIVRGMSKEDFCQKHNYKSCMYNKIKYEIKQKKIKIQNEKYRAYRTPQMVEDIKNGMRVKEFCEKHKSGRTQYYAMQKEFKIKTPRTMTNKQLEMIEDIKNGMTRQDFCEKHNRGRTCYGNIKTKLKRAGQLNHVEKI